jgi:hypothetical protein
MHTMSAARVSTQSAVASCACHCLTRFDMSIAHLHSQVYGFGSTFAIISSCTMHSSNPSCKSPLPCIVCNTRSSAQALLLCKCAARMLCRCKPMSFAIFPAICGMSACSFCLVSYCHENCKPPASWNHNHMITVNHIASWNRNHMLFVVAG